jgi:auxin efflux carrier family protein
LTIGIGYLSARSGFLNDKTQKGLQKLTINVLTPALLFANVGAQIDLQKLITLWAVPAFYVGYLCIGFIIAMMAGKICKFDWAASKFVAAGVIFQNTTSLPIALIQSIASTKAITLLMREDDTPGVATSRGISFILIASLLSNLFRYSVGTWLFNDPNPKQINESDNEDGELPDTTPLLTSTPRRRQITGMAVSGWHRAREIFNPPLLAAIVSLIVGITPPLKHLFFSQDGVFYSSLTATIRQLGQACIPMVMITLGAELYTLPRDTSSSTKEMVTAIIILKMLVMPILGGAAVLSLRQWVTDDPMLLFILILLAASPTGMILYGCIGEDGRYV